MRLPQLAGRAAVTCTEPPLPQPIGCRDHVRVLLDQSESAPMPTAQRAAQKLLLQKVSLPVVVVVVAFCREATR
ncbi:hypothetical protein HETIRDRAFT_410032 [Heterobasidion irregulare TC 32-1]|uniref:Uncharacterized protein n=1 Tax=Heterobasidion irregulare (strain TC 32-1) TaxID=747525 RepID=W4K4G4_HETIT|nr:uncharacterized protein HETIRDRAFT_410032 [Heterobasidion irregulare TC 32-1]ETW80702.1 hypothetical protein HETIRDRAFT_410032 [Heterobasidion irregulare TC 32-1]